MANDLFGGLGNLGGALGGLVGGLAKSGLVPQDTADGKLILAQTELSDLQKQEAQELMEIGRSAYEKDPSAWPQDSKLKLIRQNMEAAKATLESAKAQKAQEESQKEEENARGRCSECNHKNPDGIKFCQECGTPLGAKVERHCTSCGAALKPGVRFCGECGARMDG